MTALLQSPAPSASLSAPDCNDPLFQLQLRVARRADELARQAGSSRESDRRSWDEAEREILEARFAGPDVPIPSAA